MARPRAKELTERELEIMQAFWQHGESTAAEMRDGLARSGRELTYTTVANLVRTLEQKRFLRQINEERPFRYRPARSFEEVSGRLVRDLIHRVFDGSREQLLIRLIEQKRLTPKERAAIAKALAEANR